MATLDLAPPQAAATFGDMACFRGGAALLEAIEALAPEISARAASFEAARALPQDLFEKIVATGILRAIRPRALGGAELPVADMLPVMERLAQADGSVAWTFMIAAEAPVLWQRFDGAFLDRIFAGGRETLARFAVTPRPNARKVEGGLIVDGRWPLASGSYRPEWICVGALVLEADGTPAVAADGMPDIRLVMLPAGDVTILDTWNALGMRATESHDVEVREKYVPDEHSAPYLAIAEAGPRIGRLPIFPAAGAFHLGVVLGLARAIIDDLISLSQNKRPFLNPKILLKEDPLFQQRLGSLDTRLGAARSFALALTQGVWDATDSAPMSAVERGRYRAMLAHVHAECGAIGNEVFGLAGTSVLYVDSVLQRRFRDLRAACQHVAGSLDIFQPYGALLVGENPASAHAL